MTSERVKGHELWWEGAPFNPNTGWRLSSTGAGVGRCSCGAMSDELPSNNARKRWHRAHKDEVLAGVIPPDEQEERSA